MAGGLDEADIFLAKAGESLLGAESELANGRYNNSANRAYYACFQAAVAALIRAGIRPRSLQWGHDFVHAEFAGRLIGRRKLYPPELRETLLLALAARQTGDYGVKPVTRRGHRGWYARPESWCRQ